MASALPTAAELEWAECPFCLKIPRSGVMLHCAHRHPICVGCKNRNGDRRCPRGGCRYNDPPARNTMVSRTLSEVVRKHYKPRDVECSWAGIGKESELQEYNSVVLAPSRPPIDTHLNRAHGVKRKRTMADEAMEQAGQSGDMGQMDATGMDDDGITDLAKKIARLDC